jgi:hypothetical protein
MAESPNEFYANAVNIIANLYDVTLNFRAQSPASIDDGKTILVQSTSECTVRMSPQHAKALAVLLVQHITQYEKQFNIALPIEDNLLNLWKTLIKE